MRSERGNITVAMAIAVPLMISLTAFVANVGALVYARARLQVAVDRGVYAGTAALAHALNEMAVSNWEIRHEFSELRKWLRETTEPSEDEVRARIAQTRERQADLIDRMRSLNASMFAKALAHAQAVVEANLPGAVFMPSFVPAGEGMIRIGTAEGDGGYYESLSGADIVGSLFEPENYRVEEPERVLMYVEKTRRADVVFAGTAAAHAPLPIVSQIFGGGRPMAAAAAAQPYGGSMRDFALVDADSAKEAAAVGRELMYRVGFVPVRSVSGTDDSVLN